METDWKKIVKESYMPIIKGTLDRITLFETDSIMNYLVRVHIENPPNADEVMVCTDKFYVYKNLWKAIVETLYEKFLPSSKHSSNWTIEATPYTLMLCQLTRTHANNEELDRTLAILKITDTEIESDFESIIVKLGFDKMGMPKGLKGLIPNYLIPGSNKEHLHLILRLMNFPPLAELSLFLGLYNNVIHAQFEKLAIGFSGVDPVKLPNIGLSESLHYSYFHFSHETLKKHGIDAFINHPELIKYKEELENIKKKAFDNKDQFKDTVLCPCCGKKQEVNVGEEILQYKFILLNQELSIKIGLLYQDEFTEKFKENLSEKYYSFLPEINRVDNPECIILVEGESEEASIPLLAFRTRFILSQHGIQVYNSKSKQKLKEDFFSMRSNYPNRKIICLLDADAEKERADIERVIKDQKNKYKLVFIDKGTFEDLFDLDVSIQMLNDLYPGDDAIVLEDFNTSKDFLQNIDKILFTKRKAKFDKVAFAKKISLRMDIEHLPKEIKEIIETAREFTQKGMYFKK